MSRFLDADKVLVFQIFDDETEEIIEKEYSIEDFVDTFAVDGCPKTVDAEPIRHGHWIPVNPDVYGAEYFECSVCRMYSRDGLWRKELDYEYCPNCGAKMDETGEEE